MDRSRALSWSLGIALLSLVVSPFAFILMLLLMPFSPWPPFGEPIFVTYGVLVAVLFSFFALVFRNSLAGRPNLDATSKVLRHPRISLPLFLIGIGYSIFVSVGFFSSFTGWGVGLLSAIFAVVLYPLQFVLPGPNSGATPWPMLTLLLYLSWPGIVISLLLFRWRARVMALILGSLTFAYTLMILGTFVLIAAAFS